MTVTDAFGHIDVVGVVILTLGVTEPLIDIVIEFDVAVAGDAHVELDVMIHVTTCPLVSVVVV